MVVNQINEMALFLVIKLGPNDWLWFFLLLALDEICLIIVDSELD